MSRFSFLMLISVVLMVLAAPAQAATVVVPGLPPVAVPDPPYSGAVLHLTFDEGSGNITYNAVNPLENNGTLYDDNTSNTDGDTPPQWTTGVAGKALQFDGVDDYVEVPNSNSLQINGSITICAWVKLDTLTGRRAVVRKFTATDGYLLELRDNDIEFIIREAGVGLDYIIANNVLTAGEWFFIAAVYDGVKLYLYVNGELVTEKTSSVSLTTTNTVDVLIGSKSYYAPNVYFDGLMDSVFIFNRALSEQEIKLLYQRGASHRLDVQPNVREIAVPRIDLLADSTTASATFEISASRSDAIVPVPAGARVNAPWAYTIDGKVLQIDDNRYVNASSVTAQVPLRVESNVVDEIPETLYLDSEHATYTYEKQIRIYNPSDISVLASLTVPRKFDTVFLNGAPLSIFNNDFVSAIALSPGEAKELTLRAEASLNMQEIELPATLDDFLKIDSFAKAEKFANSITQSKLETKAKIIRIDASNLGNRSVVLSLKLNPKDIIEARAVTGSKEMLHVRQGRKGRAEITIPAQVFEGDEFAKTAEIKILYNHKPSILERLGLASLASLIEKIKRLLGGG